MAFLNPLIRADMIEVTEFPELGKEAGVKAVPKTIVNHFVDLEGALPEDQFIDRIIKNVNK
jgi:predicted DsbA family dithiol-disulfide isomerase